MEVEPLQNSHNFQFISIKCISILFSFMEKNPCKSSKIIVSYDHWVIKLAHYIWYDNWLNLSESQLARCKRECGEQTDLKIHELTLSYEEQKEELQRELEMRDREVSSRYRCWLASPLQFEWYRFTFAVVILKNRTVHWFQFRQQSTLIIFIIY